MTCGLQAIICVGGRVSGRSSAMPSWICARGSAVSRPCSKCFTPAPAEARGGRDRRASRHPARRSRAAAAALGAGKNPVLRHQLRQTRRRLRADRKPEISEHVLPRAEFAGRARAEPGSAEGLRTARLRGRDRDRDRPRVQARGEGRRARDRLPALLYATRARSAIGCATASSTSPRARISTRAAASGRGSKPGSIRQNRCTSSCARTAR